MSESVEGAGVRKVARLVLMAPIRFYQYAISPMYPPRCKYYPTCSSYAMTAISRHGVIRGMGLALWRLARCNPWSMGGVDYVPPVRSQEPDSQGARTS